jgi:hypothetical protein
VNGKAALSSILARSNLGEAKGSDFASGLPRTIVSRALSTASGLMLIADRKTGRCWPGLFDAVRDLRDRSRPGQPVGAASDWLIC